MYIKDKNEVDNDGVYLNDEKKLDYDYNYYEDDSVNDGVFIKSHQQNTNNFKFKQLALKLLSLLNKKPEEKKPSIYLHVNLNNSLTNASNFKKENHSKLIDLLQNNVKYTKISKHEITKTRITTTTTITRSTSKISNSNSKHDVLHPYFYLQSDTTSSYYSSSLNDLSYKNNELYSIFVSMFTAALFIFFIMWRWIKMKSDLRKALREQLEIQQQQQEHNNESNNRTNQLLANTSSSNYSSISPLRTSPNYLLHNRENLEAILNELTNRQSNNSRLSSRQNQHIIDTAKYCLQQLRHQSRQNRNDRNGRNSNFRSLIQNELHRNSILEPNNLTNSNHHHHRQNMHESSSSSNLNYQNELPPPYESIMTKSSSLPSYYHLTLK